MATDTGTAIGRVTAAPPRPQAIWTGGVVAAGVWLAVAALTAGWPDADEETYRTIELALIMATVGALLLLVSGASRQAPFIVRRVRPLGPWLVVAAVLVAVWEVSTAKTRLLPMPFFAPPQGLLEVYIDDWQRLLESVGASMWLLTQGYVIGSVLGFLTGLALGWSQKVGYWVHPVLRLVGPLPATAWLPIAFFAFPTSGSASVFLIALATGFPVTVLTWSGIAGVNKAFYDIARTMGASERFLILKVAVPAAMPHVFVGLFMGLGASFSVLVVAEMLGVKSGLGWYLQWAQGWAAYGNMYAALLVMALMCSGLITLLFRARDRLLSWQRGLVRW